MSNEPREAHDEPLTDLDDSGEPDFIIEGQPAPISEGEYQLAFLYSETLMTPWGPKVCLWFEIFSGPHQGRRLRRFYNVKSIDPPTRRGGRFTPKGAKSSLFREWVAVCGPPPRGASLSFRAFKRLLIEAEVVTVCTDGNGDPLPPGTEYSEIRRLLSGKNADE